MAISNTLRGWGFVTPALFWTLAFFVAPFASMVAMSLATLEGRELIWGLDLANYRRLFGQSFLSGAIIVSLQITLTVTLISILLAYPLSWIIAFRVPPRW